MTGWESLAYVLTPLAAWIVAGSLKFVVNSLRAGRPAWEQIGYGGWPSTHAAIVGGTAVLMVLRRGWGSAEAGLAFTLALIVVLDATGLRRHLAEHAKALRRVLGPEASALIRERLAHTWGDVLGGLVVGSLCAVLLQRLLPH